MNVLLLGPNRPDLVDFLQRCNDRVKNTEEKSLVDRDFLQDIEFIISYGYRHILKKELLDKFPEKAINVHISLLPWNRGADPNLWSFLENTPKGVTIHYLDSGIDTGKILVQQEANFSSEETLKTSYEKLSIIAENLLKESWVDIRDGKIQPRDQSSGGSYHRLRDRQPYEHLLTQGWDTPVRDLIGKATQKNTYE
jgi:methionyl-tRNA formyltransferase